jgi:hypothetical protein
MLDGVSLDPVFEMSLPMPKILRSKNWLSIVVVGLAYASFAFAVVVAFAAGAAGSP